MFLSETQVKTLLLFNHQDSFKHQGLHLLVTRLREIYRKNPSAENLQYCHKELNSFIQKYEILLPLDLEQINNLKETDL